MEKQRRKEAWIIIAEHKKRETFEKYIRVANRWKHNAAIKIGLRGQNKNSEEKSTKKNVAYRIYKNALRLKGR